MNWQNPSVNVLAAPAIDPGEHRVELELPQGLTVAEYVHAALPGASEADLLQARVALVTSLGSMTLEREHWCLMRPKDGVRVVIRIVPDKDALKAVLAIVVTIAAVALGNVFGATIAGSLGVSNAVGTALVTAGASMIGQLLLNALIPPPEADTSGGTSYSVTGWRNKLDPDGALPAVLGTMRYAPPFAARPYTEIVGDDQYLRSLFVFGEGQLDIDDLRIGETSLSEFDEVELEVRSGLVSDLPVSLIPQQVVEEQIGVELTRPLPRDNAGDVIAGGAAIETPVVRTTGSDAAGASLIIAFPAGLNKFTTSGKKLSHSVEVRVEQRLLEAVEWQTVETLKITASKTEGFYRQHSWSFPSRGRWQVRLTMLSPEVTTTLWTQRATWAALQTLRPEYPIAFSRPLALVSVRIKATHQLQGALDSFNALVALVCLDWDSDTQDWISRATSNPAALYRHVLQSSANPKPVAEADLDLEQLQDWAEFCDDKGLTYNRVLDDAGRTLRDVLTEIAAAGRATPRHDGAKWGVVIDRPAANALIVDHINPRNSWGFNWQRSYVEPPHAFVTTFKDAGNDYVETQRQIRWPGYEGEITLTEDLPQPGKTDAAEVWREGRRRQLEIIHRPDSYEATQEGAIRAVTRGDDVMLNHDVLSRVQIAARVNERVGRLVEIDELVEPVEGENYAIRFRIFSDGNTIGTSEVRTVKVIGQAGTASLLELTGDGAEPQEGDIVHFGPSVSESSHLIVRNVEATRDMCSILRLVDAAPQIDTILETTPIPAWSSRVGAELDDNVLQPSAPRFTRVFTGVSGTENADQIVVLLEPGSGVVPAAQFEIDHRLLGESTWNTITVPVANGGGSLDFYNSGQSVELQARAVSATGVEGPYSTLLTVEVGAEDAPIPIALDEASVSFTELLGGALVQFATNAGENTTQVQLYRSTSAVLDRETDAVGEPLVVAPLQSHSISVGDLSRSNLVSGSQMNDASAWSEGDGWDIGGGVAQHSLGLEGELGQPFSAEVGKFYRIQFSVSGLTSGTITPRLSGGSDRLGTGQTGDGIYSDRIQAVTGNDRFEFHATQDANGTIDDVLIYLETSGCLDQGNHYLWLEPQNADDVPGPVSGPFTIKIP